MKNIPLTSKDIPPGSCIRKIINKDIWYSVSHVDKDHVFILAYPMWVDWNYLSQWWEIYHPIVYPNWKKCYKIEHTQQQGDPIIEHPDV